jgi:PAS domain S-box-containing protein
VANSKKKLGKKAKKKNQNVLNKKNKVSASKKTKKITVPSNNKKTVRLNYFKNIEKESQDISKLNEELQRMGKIGAWEFEIENNKILWTDESYRIYGVKKGTEIGFDQAISFCLGKDRLKIAQVVKDCILHKKSYLLECKIKTKDNKLKWVRCYGEAITNSKNKVYKIRGTIQDITQKKNLEISLRRKNADLKKNESNLETIIQCTYDGIWDWHIPSDYEYMSPRFWQMLGYEPQEKQHHPSEWMACIFPEDLILLNEKYDKHIKSLGDELFFQEVRFLHKNGQTVWILCRGQVIEWHEKRPIRMVGAHTDITELKKAQINLQENARLISLGEMAGGIAHEINNPLAIINSSAEILAKHLIKNGQKNPMTTKLVDNIVHTVSRISKIVEGLKKLSRQTAENNLEESRIHDVIMDALSLCTEKFKSRGIELNIDLYENYLIQCRPIELSQVIVNLLNNSYYAVQKKNDAMVSLKVIEKDEDQVSIVIIDNGHGIPEAVKDKIMQPFFTTKPVGEGTGLGLSISREIVDKMGGKLWLESSNEEGTTFCIDLKKTNKIKSGSIAS